MVIIFFVYQENNWMKNICTSVRVILRDQRPNISSVASQYCEAKSPKPHHIRPFFFFKSQGKANNPSRISLLLFIRHCGISVQIYNMYSHCAGQSRPTLNTPCSKKPLPLHAHCPIREVLLTLCIRQKRNQIYIYKLIMSERQKTNSAKCSAKVCLSGV